MSDYLKGLELSRYHRWKLNKIGKSDPIKDLLKSDTHKADVGADVSSFASLIVALIALAAAGFGLYYVSDKQKIFKDRTALGLVVLKSSKTLVFRDLNIHYVCVPEDLSTPLQITLPTSQTVTTTANPSICSISTYLPLGTFFSLSLPMPYATEGSPDSRSAIITFPAWKSLTCTQYPSQTFTVAVNTSYVFMISEELLNFTWKVVQSNN